MRQILSFEVNQRKVTVDPHRAYNRGKSFIKSMMANAHRKRSQWYHHLLSFKMPIEMWLWPSRTITTNKFLALTESYNHLEIRARDDGSSVNLLVIAEVFVAFVKVKICQC